MATGVPGLGPHVVGRRVVVRRVVPGETGPSGGPALTDVVGELTAWGESTLTVETERGPVSVDRALVVAGKPVPARPVAGHRVGVAETEARVLSLWPRLEVEPLGDWWLRSDPAPVGRLRKRANSALALGDPGLPLTEALGRVRRFYDARGRDVVVQLEAGGALDDRLAGLGWPVVAGGEAQLMLGPLHRAHRASAARGAADPAGAGPGAVRLEEDGDLLRVTSDAGAVEAALDDGWLGVHDLHVEPGHRRRGWGRRLMAEALAWGEARGAGTLWLHVEVGNAPAIALYEGLGLRSHHVMRYRTPPEPETEAGTGPASTAGSGPARPTLAPETGGA